MRRDARLELTDEHWRTAELVPVVPDPDPARVPRRLAAALLAAATVVLVASWGRNDVRCHQDCYGAPPKPQYGSITYEPGHPWTRYADSWQWSAHHGLAVAAFLLAAVALGLALARRWRPTGALVLATACLAGWLVWLVLMP